MQLSVIRHPIPIRGPWDEEGEVPTNSWGGLEGDERAINNTAKGLDIQI